MPMEDLTTRVAAAYDAACSDTQDPVRGEGGGFLVNDSLAGGFVPDADPVSYTHLTLPTKA